MVKTIEALVSVKFFMKNSKIFQHFIIEKKRGVSKYLLDPRFLVYDRLEEKIKEFALSNISADYLFTERRDEKDRIVIEYITNKTDKPQNYYFVVPGFVPETSGCFDCKFRNDKNDNIGSFYCTFKKKSFTHKLKNCAFFRQKDGLFKT